MTTTHQMPELLPVPTEDPKDMLGRAQAAFPKVVPGKTVEVDPHVVEVREYAKYAIKFWQAQAAIANASLQWQMGDAEQGTVNSVPVVTRVQSDVKGHWVEDGDRDFLRAASS